MPTLIDHLFVTLFAVIFPVYSWWSYRRIQQRIAAGQPVKRINLYRWTIIEQWALAIIGVVIWLTLERQWKWLGFSLELDWMFWLAVAITVLLLGYFAYTSINAKSMPEEQRKNLMQTIKHLQLEPLLPTNNRELKSFYSLSITAGIVEELLWRGFLWWYLSLLLPAWQAAIIVIAAFGFAHIYQGISGVVRTGILGAVFLGLYWLSGSIWLSMVLHALLDILQGYMLFTVLTQEQHTTQEHSSA